MAASPHEPPTCNTLTPSSLPWCLAQQHHRQQQAVHPAYMCCTLPLESVQQATALCDMTSGSALDSTVKAVQPPTPQTRLHSRSPPPAPTEVWCVNGHIFWAGTAKGRIFSSNTKVHKICGRAKHTTTHVWGIASQPLNTLPTATSWGLAAAGWLSQPQLTLPHTSDTQQPHASTASLHCGSTYAFAATTTGPGWPICTQLWWPSCSSPATQPHECMQLGSGLLKLASRSEGKHTGPKKPTIHNPKPFVTVNDAAGTCCTQVPLLPALSSPPQTPQPQALHLSVPTGTHLCWHPQPQPAPCSPCPLGSCISRLLPPAACPPPAQPAQGAEAGRAGSPWQPRTGSATGCAAQGASQRLWQRPRTQSTPCPLPRC